MGTDGATLDLDEHAAMLASRKRPDFVITGVKRDDVATAARVLRARGLAVPLAHSFDDGATFALGCHVG